jgi:hypothetical protein
MLYCIEGPSIGSIGAVEQIGGTSIPAPGDYPYNGSVTVTATVGSYQSMTQFTATSDSLSISASNARDGGNATSADYSSSDCDIFFTPTENVSYTVAAQYSASNPSAALGVVLDDITQSNSSLLAAFANPGFSLSGPQSFDLSTGGNVSYAGSLTGALTAGDEYEFVGVEEITASTSFVDSGATGSGTISIDFAPIPTGPASVPLPATFATSVAMLGLVAAWRRYKAFATGC